MVIGHGPSFEQLAVNRLDDEIDASAAIGGDEIYLRGQTGSELDGSRFHGLGHQPADAAEQADQAMKNAKTLLEEADGLLATFNALLRIAQVESGNRRARFEAVNVAEILNDVVELYEPLAEDKITYDNTINVTTW